MKKFLFLSIIFSLAFSASSASSSKSSSDSSSISSGERKEEYSQFRGTIKFRNKKLVWRSDDGDIQIFEGDCYTNKITKNWTLITPYQCILNHKYLKTLGQSPATTITLEAFPSLIISLATSNAYKPEAHALFTHSEYL